jgi:putative membrane protein
MAMMDWDGHGGVGWVGWLMMALTMAILWGAIAVGAIALWRTAGRDRSTPPQARPDARQLLDERLARGEIDGDEYARRRQLLDANR